MPRFFLFLQGCTCPFFHVLGRVLRQRGHRVGHISFNVGDALLWRAGQSWAYRGSSAGFSPFLLELLRKEGVSDLVMLGDTRPLHESAIRVARTQGLKTHIWEEGYFRPYWLTMERDGINGYSRLPGDPHWYREKARGMAEPVTQASIPTPIWRLAVWELAYHLPNVLNPIHYPGYRTHRPAISPVEFAGWGRRFACMPYYRRRDAARLAALWARGRRYFLFPLQLDGDGQITHHSPFGRKEAAIRSVLASFAAHAPADHWLVVKNHPLDTGLERYAAQVSSIARSLDIADRVLFLETGHLPDLFAHCAGVVLVNSTVGTAALAAGLPVIALGRAIYDLPGLTFQEGLDAFWHDPHPPDAELFADFRRVVIHATQVRGSFYSRMGCEQAALQALRLMEPERSPLEVLL